MTKDDLIEALRETGIVARENDANGIRLLLTQQDFETLREKSIRAKRQARLLIIQSVALLATMICLIISTVYGFFSQEEFRYYKEQNYVVRVSIETGESCYISTGYRSEESAFEEAVFPCFPK